MDISLRLKFLGLEVLGLEALDGGRPDGGPVSHLILLTELRHVNAAAHSK
jgi:hypothetical protein